VGEPPSARRLLAAFLEELAGRLHVLERTGMGPLRDEWMERAAGIGEMVTATSPAGTVTGVAEGLDDDGALLLRGAAGTVRVLAADVHLGRPGA
jgi:BirA family biotin operon repressor/biotin-[acetyl-CoA-carboxylase] ligase